LTVKTCGIHTTVLTTGIDGLLPAGNIDYIILTKVHVANPRRIFVLLATDPMRLK
jgi:hypothetical protein